MGRVKKISLKDVALKSGVSATTASLVLNGRWEEQRIAPATRDAVVAAAQELGYEPPKATPKAPDAKSLWCIFTPVDLDSGPTAEFLRGVRDYITQNRLSVETIVFPFERDRLHEQARWITREFTSGVVMAGLNDSDVEFVESTDFNIPVILFNRATTRCSTITVDDYGVGQTAMRQFAERGRSRIAIVAPDFASRHLSLRAVGLTDELDRISGSAATAEHVRDENSLAGGYNAMDRLLSTGEAPDAVFIINDAMAAGVVHRLEEASLRVPEDLDVISFGNAPVNTLSRPSLTSIELPIGLMGHECAMLLDQASINPDAKERISRVFDAEIVYRESSPAV